MNKILLKKENSSYGYDYELIKDDLYPDFKNITAVSILLKYKNKIFLTKNHRGWELPGGHIEENETFLDTIKREVKEEVGTNIKNCFYWGYKKIILKEPIKKRDGGYYPFPFGYILYFIGESTEEIFKAYGEEVIDSGLFSYEEALEKIENVDTKNNFKILYNN